MKNNMANGLFFCVTLTSCKRDHTPLVQAGAETSDTGAEALKPDPGCSWQGPFQEGGRRRFGRKYGVS